MDDNSILGVINQIYNMVERNSASNALKENPGILAEPLQGRLALNPYMQQMRQQYLANQISGAQLRGLNLGNEGNEYDLGQKRTAGFNPYEQSGRLNEQAITGAGTANESADIDLQRKQAVKGNPDQAAMDMLLAQLEGLDTQNNLLEEQVTSSQIKSMKDFIDYIQQRQAAFNYGDRVNPYVNAGLNAEQARGSSQVQDSNETRRTDNDVLRALSETLPTLTQPGGGLSSVDVLPEGSAIPEQRLNFGPLLNMDLGTYSNLFNNLNQGVPEGQQRFNEAGQAMAANIAAQEAEARAAKLANEEKVKLGLGKAGKAVSNTVKSVLDFAKQNKQGFLEVMRQMPPTQLGVDGRVEYPPTPLSEAAQSLPTLPNFTVGGLAGRGGQTVLDQIYQQLLQRQQATEVDQRGLIKPAKRR